MDFLSPMDGMQFNPISDYNKYIKETKALEVDDNSSFENVLSQKTAELQNALPVQGGIEISNGAGLLDSPVDAAASSSPVSNFFDSLSSTVGGSMHSVNNKIEAANKAQEAFAMGDDSVSVHDVMIASEKASLSLNLAMQMRNKLMSAYTELNSIKV